MLSGGKTDLMAAVVAGAELGASFDAAGVGGTTEG